MQKTLTFSIFLCRDFCLSKMTPIIRVNKSSRIFQVLELFFLYNNMFSKDENDIILCVRTTESTVICTESYMYVLLSGSAMDDFALAGMIFRETPFKPRAEVKRRERKCACLPFRANFPSGPSSGWSGRKFAGSDYFPKPQYS